MEQKDKATKAVNDFITRSTLWLNKNLLKIENEPGTDDQKADKVINLIAIVCAGVAVQPIPFADFFILTPIQIYMGSRLAKIYGWEISKEESEQIVKNVLGAIGMGVIAQHLAIGIYKFIPFLGAITTIPIVYGLTSAIGGVIKKYIKCKIDGTDFVPKEMNEFFTSIVNDSKQRGKDLIDEVKKTAEDIKEEKGEDENDDKQ